MPMPLPAAFAADGRAPAVDVEIRRRGGVIGPMAVDLTAPDVDRAVLRPAAIAVGRQVDSRSTPALHPLRVCPLAAVTVPSA